jgi:hypothetical protein
MHNEGHSLGYQLYVIGGSKADDYHHGKLGVGSEVVVLHDRNSPLSCP